MEIDIEKIIEEANIEIPYIAIIGRYGGIVENEFDSFKEAVHFLSTTECSGEGSAIGIIHFDTAYLPDDEIFGTTLKQMTDSALAEFKKLGRNPAKVEYFKLDF